MDRPKSPYSEVCEEEMILRDHLAAERTVLANERTALAYLRTMLTFLIGGVTFLHFFHSFFAELLGLLFVPAGFIVGAFGLVKYVKVKRDLAQIGTAVRDREREEGGE